MDYKKKRIIVVIKAFNEYLRVKMNKKEVQNFFIGKFACLITDSYDSKKKKKILMLYFFVVAR